ncbi:MULTISPECIES: hypothetical protein [unclassified Sphingomonas]|jgi:alpha-D-ribose 1-methylphosphonate 5-triphosphate synthase subunit PhnI|uniref:hypothetical protein n=1 Tax=unclassified Sphingomonas TaxID=196159 RepID=UPI0006F4EDF9|nr:MULTISPECIES: hypothetical protein [unclassified Sphingomonas]KQN28184.1 hypothetical protein ASF00_09800 [Sphingomonas sp. Leaf34]KQN29830.1 hypothetical protein ASE88_13455 [Sphingomonas sp. Leaf38]
MINPLLIPILAICCGLLAIFGGVVVRPWFAYKHRRMELDAQMIAEKSAQYAAHTDRLEQRVRVLERIVTDRGVELSDQIDQLLDDRPHNTTKTIQEIRS